jgi:4-amino-4-deoxy-L-arabinose transferase-like glycosyltransferase
MLAIFFKNRPYAAAVSVVLLLSAFRLFLTTRYPLSPDEAHYWMWSKHLDWFYFSKGPVIAWLIALGTSIGGDTEIGVRWPAVLLSACTLVLLFFLGKRLFAPVVGWFCLLAGVITPMFAFGSIVMTIDAPSVFFWAAACAAGWQAWRANTIGWWTLTGFCVGLGFLSKYTNAVQGLCFLLFMLLTNRGWHLLTTIAPWLGATTALICTLPYWIWNAQNNWVSWEHLLSRGQLTVGESETIKFSIRLSEFFSFVGLQALVISPLLWLLMLFAVFWAVKKTTANLPSLQNRNLPEAVGDDIKLVYLLCQSVPLFLFFGLFALNDAGQPNWTAPGYCTAAILTGFFLKKFWNCSSLLRRGFYASAIFSLVCTAALHDTRPLRLPPEIDPLARVRGWDVLSEKVLAAQKQHKADFILANHYGLVAALCWHLPGERGGMRVYRSQTPDRINDQFSLWPNYFHRTGQSAILVVQLKKIRVGSTQRPPRSVRNQFESWEPIGEPFWVEQDSLRVAPYALFLMRNLKNTLQDES